MTNWNWETIGSYAGTVASTGAGLEVIRWFRSRNSDAAQVDVNRATAFNQLSLTVGNLSKALSDLQKRFDTAEEELNKYRRAQSRVERLLNEALVALRDFMDITRQRGLPVPEMSEELRAAIAEATT